MDSQTASKIPTIDFSEGDLNPGSSSWSSTYIQVRQALEEFGYFVAVYDKVPQEVCHNMISQSKALFEVPNEIKVKNTYEDSIRGYIGPKPHLPYYETFGIDNATDPEQVHKFMNLIWPTGKDQFSETTNFYVKSVAELGQMVLQMLFESYGAGKHYESLAASNSHLLRLIKYREAKDSDTSIWLLGHTDTTFITILFQHQIGGFQIKTKDGNFIGIEAKPSHFVVLAGDMLQVWSNDRIRACYHQVKISAKVERYSLGVFIFNTGIIQVPEELVDEEHPLRYKQCDCLGYSTFAFSEEAKNVDSRIKAYCGV